MHFWCSWKDLAPWIDLLNWPFCCIAAQVHPLRAKFSSIADEITIYLMLLNENTQLKWSSSFVWTKYLVARDWTFWRWTPPGTSRIISPKRCDRYPIQHACNKNDHYYQLLTSIYYDTMHIYVVWSSNCVILTWQCDGARDTDKWIQKTI